MVLARANVQLFEEAKVAYLRSRNSNNRRKHNSHYTSIVDNRCCFVRQLMACRNLEPPITICEPTFCGFSWQFLFLPSAIFCRRQDGGTWRTKARNGTAATAAGRALAASSGHSCGKFARDRCRDNLKHLEQICRRQCCRSSGHYRGDIQNPKKKLALICKMSPSEWKR